MFLLFIITMEGVIRYLIDQYKKPENNLKKVILTYGVLFSFLAMVRLGTFFFNSSGYYYFFVSYLTLNLSDRWHIFYHPWVLLTYTFLPNELFAANPMQLLHASLKLFLDISFIFSLGTLFVNYFNSKYFLHLYFLTSIGAPLLASFFCKNLILYGPSVIFNSLIASIALLRPHYRYFFFIEMQHIALLLAGFYMLHWGAAYWEGNAPDEHFFYLAGMGVGFFYTHYLQQGGSRCIKNFFHLSFQYFFQKKIKKKSTKGKKFTQKEIQRLLEKIEREGYAHLTDEEKMSLFNA